MSARLARRMVIVHPRTQTIGQVPLGSGRLYEPSRLGTCTGKGRLIGRMEGLGFRFREEAVLSTLTQDVLKSSEIEREFLDIDQVRSSIARRLGLDIGGVTSRRSAMSDGVVEMMLDATQKHQDPLTEEPCSAGTRPLFPIRDAAAHAEDPGQPVRRDDNAGLDAGCLRADRQGAGPLHQAPTAERIPAEMDRSSWIGLITRPRSIPCSRRPWPSLVRDHPPIRRRQWAHSPGSRGP